MISPIILSLLVKPSVPSGLWFNQFGVAMQVLKATRYYKKCHYDISIACFQGKWGCGIDYSGPYEGFYMPLSIGEFKYNTPREAINSRMGILIPHWKNLTGKEPEIPRSHEFFFVNKYVEIPY